MYNRGYVTMKCPLIYNDENVLFANTGAEFLILFRGKTQKLHHVRTKAAFLHILRNGEVILAMDKV